MLIHRNNVSANKREVNCSKGMRLCANSLNDLCQIRQKRTSHTGLVSETCQVRHVEPSDLQRQMKLSLTTRT